MLILGDGPDLFSPWTHSVQSHTAVIREECLFCTVLLKKSKGFPKKKSSDPIPVHIELFSINGDFTDL